jgi:hypothetical protein
VPQDVQPPRARGKVPLEPAQLGGVLPGEPPHLAGHVLIQRQDWLFRGRRGHRDGREDGGRRARD